MHELERRVGLRADDGDGVDCDGVMGQMGGPGRPKLLPFADEAMISHD